MFSNLEQGFIIGLLGVIAYSVFRMAFDLAHIQRHLFGIAWRLEQMAIIANEAATAALEEMKRHRGE